jgi:hypothetical protein
LRGGMMRWRWRWRGVVRRDLKDLKDLKGGSVDVDGRVECGVSVFRDFPLSGLW